MGGRQSRPRGSSQQQAPIPSDTPAPSAAAAPSGKIILVVRLNCPCLYIVTVSYSPL